MKIFVTLLTLLIFSEANAIKQVIEDEVIYNCSLTPNFIKSDNIQAAPKPTNKSNNLRRKAGSPEIAKGKLIRIVGRVVDERCLPVTNATVEIWQPNHKGFYKMNISQNSDEFDKNFLESGITRTDNLGKYDFASIYPGKIENRSSFINVKVQHPDFEPMQTLIYFSDDNFNEYDSFFKKLLKKEQKKITAVKQSRPANMNPVEVTYVFNITLKGKTKFKRY